MEHRIISEDEFYTKFNLVKNHIDNNASFDGCMFETFSKEREFVLEINKVTPKRVWTIVETDGKLYYESGYHSVNRLGYLITEETVENDTEYTVVLEDLTDDEYQCKECGDRFNELENECCPNCGSDNFVKGCVDGGEEE